jgi:histidine triad (HIT) family protein
MMKTLEEDCTLDNQLFFILAHNSSNVFEVSADLFSTVHKIIPKIDKISGATLLAIHNGKESGQEIPHVHVHLIPRRSDDLAGPVHSMFKNKPKLSDEELDELCAKIKNS